MPTAKKSTASKTDSPEAIEVSTPSIEEKTAKTTKTVKCAPHPALNVREKPNKEAPVVDFIPDGVSVECEADKRGWFKVEGGYVMSKYLV